MIQDNIEDDKRIKDGLRRIRLVRIWWSGIFISFIPFGFLAVTFRPPIWFFVSIGSIWCASLAVLGLIHAFVKCPSCNKTFNVRGLTAFGFTQKCMHCGLPLKSKKTKTEV